MEMNLYCPINPTTGYGITSTHTAIALDKLGIKISLFNIGGQSPTLEREEHKNPLMNMLNNGNIYNKKAPCLKIWHQHELASRIGTGDYYVMPFFEADKFHDREVHHINQADGVFTPTKWGKKILEENGVKIPIYVAPLGVDMSVFFNNSILVENDNYVFLHVGKWEKRKSQDFLLKCFEKAFTHKDNVELRLVPDNPFLNKEQTEKWHNLVRENKLSKKINIYQRIPTQKLLSEVMSKADCGVFLSRAEGWNNEIPEVMALNKPIIATNYSAHTEYCTTENSFLVDVDETEPANDGKWFHGHGNWAKLGEKQLEQTVEHMRFVYNNNIRTNPNGVETAKLYSWDNTASVIYQTLLENDSYNVK